MHDDDVKKLASLSRIALSDEDVALFTKDFGAILGYVQELQHIAQGNTDGKRTVVNSELRDDIVIPFSDSNAIIKQFPDQDGDQVRVPKVLSYED